jgi:hypothetical protein
MIKGWAFGILDRSINVCSGSENRRRVDVDVLMFDDSCTVKRSIANDGAIRHTSSIIKDTDVYVVWVTGGSGSGYTIQFRDRRMNFGGLHHVDTLEAATATFDRLRGAEHHQPTLF